MQKYGNNSTSKRKQQQQQQRRNTTTRRGSDNNKVEAIDLSLLYVQDTICATIHDLAIDNEDILMSICRDDAKEVIVTKLSNQRCDVSVDGLCLQLIHTTYIGINGQVIELQQRHNNVKIRSFYGNNKQLHGTIPSLYTSWTEYKNWLYTIIVFTW